MWGGVPESWISYAEEYFWNDAWQEPRLQDLVRHGFLPDRCKVLDLAAGCGQFVRHALSAGYDCWGVEPESWKLVYARRRAQSHGYPQDRTNRILEGVGETIPFGDCEFDIVTTYQTLEHVRNPKRVLQEMVRVTRVGGGIHIRCPDYRSTFEAHYQLPWLPLFPRQMAKAYLRFMGRPTAGLDTIRYVTGPRIRRWLTEIEGDGDCRLSVSDDDRNVFENAMRRRFVPCWPGMYGLWHTAVWLRNLGRHESSVNMFVRVLGKMNYPAASCGVSLKDTETTLDFK